MTTTSMSATMTDIFAAFILVAVLAKLLLKKKESDKYKPKRVDRSEVQTASPDSASAESVLVQNSIGNSSESRYNSQVANPYWRADTTPTMWHQRTGAITDPTTLKRCPSCPLHANFWIRLPTGTEPSQYVCAANRD